MAIATHTWVLMGIVAPVEIRGSSMAPTLAGAGQRFRCDSCGERFSRGNDELALGLSTDCPACGSVATVAIARLHGDRLIVDRTAYLFRAPRRWEIVVFHAPALPHELTVKRVIGLPGETVAIAGGVVQINGRPLSPPADIALRWAGVQLRYGDEQQLRSGWQLGPTEYLVLGDQAAISDDSRNWPAGPALDQKWLVGKPWGVR